MTQDYISASEINEYLYCHRAWWYRLRGFISANQAVVDAGAEEHESLAEAVQEVTRFQQPIRRRYRFLDGPLPYIAPDQPIHINPGLIPFRLQLFRQTLGYVPVIMGVANEDLRHPAPPARMRDQYHSRLYRERSPQAT